MKHIEMTEQEKEEFDAMNLGLTWVPEKEDYRVDDEKQTIYTDDMLGVHRDENGTMWVSGDVYAEERRYR
jgi:hypothetical protein